MHIYTKIAKNYIKILLMKNLQNLTYKGINNPTKDLGVYNQKKKKNQRIMLNSESLIKI